MLLKDRRILQDLLCIKFPKALPRRTIIGRNPRSVAPLESSDELTERRAKKEGESNGAASEDSSLPPFIRRMLGKKK